MENRRTFEGKAGVSRRVLWKQGILGLVKHLLRKIRFLTETTLFFNAAKLEKFLYECILAAV